MSLNFGTPKTASSFTIPTTSATPITAGSSGGDGAGDTKLQTNKPLTNLFGSSASNTGFLLNATPKTGVPSINFGLTTTQGTTSAPGFAITPAISTTTAQFNLGATTAAATTSATSFTPIFGTGTSISSTIPAATSAPLKLTASLAPASTAVTTTPNLGLGLAGITTTPAATTQAAAAATSATTIPATGTLTYAQLEDSINKWTIDLEEQGKFFINQAKQLNAWDNLLVSNSDKILALNEIIERVKQQQRQLDQDLDFVLAQQNELDELSLPLEKQLADIPVTDQSRFQTYQLSEIIDSQLKQMSEDLKEIVEHLNESNKNEDISDPVIQISRILNAHMNSLQWVDRNTSQICSHLEQISQLHETCKKNHLNL